MLEELFDAINTLEFEENGGIGVISAARQNDNEDLELIIQINTGQDEAVQKWSLVCRSEREHNIVLSWGENLEVASDHILLWPYTEMVCSLWFSGLGQNASTVIGELLREHHKMVGSWFSLSRFLNSSLVAGGHGKLAEGPEPLIIAYQQVMQKNGFKASITSGLPSHWNGQAWVKQAFVKPSELVVLLVGGSRVIASSVEARRTG